MAYQALYRVWRPQSFEDVAGQEHVTKTLQNALLQQKISHAYLFSGPRGTGKTSAAKILAKAINCERAPVAEPCNECAACLGITDGSIPDVIEIDAASNNGVEEIRDIRDKVKFAPNAVPYKVYIIDEVHMLSIGAFNALLKTLEEPPQHVIFILATTEPHKIPLTIISRCQRFDFKRITAKDIIKRMVHIANGSGIQFEEKAFEIIARAAEGGLRDALSLLDQAVSFSDEAVTVEDALTVTGAISQEYLNQLAISINDNNVAQALQTLDELLYQGKDPARFTEDLILYYRDMLLYRTAPNLEESIERVMVDTDFQNLSKKITSQQIYEYIDILNKTQQEMKFSNIAKMYIEVALIRLCEIKSSPTTDQNGDIQKLLGKIERLEEELKNLKTQGLVVTHEEKPQAPKKAARIGKGYKVQTGRIHDILKGATKQDLQLIKSRWGDMLEMLNNRQMRSQAALLNEAEPVAASNNAFVLKFKYEIHCQMAMENHTFLEAISSILQELTGMNYQVAGIPENQWNDVREDYLKNSMDSEEQSHEQTEEDPFIAEAKKIVGTDLMEIKD
ncbi:DNA polymerase III subunit gamma/tau [Bacillus sp. FJAT-49736]|uniref:DNA polymerase III subunit gamma/tau n=1 Tax=Bacillus sp. FJAT-49736 TaxID=2833582 RepID=UPI001BCA05ED|nr:DNA polymerase III subunit gamma/tau [Bacillus sp. FJAT-49736]MBS4175872.1 DNA polymerase III subunit gamma/tau [Bacillus sp. FJAT-49736]MBS4175900.1 DNA polymerase III subunit gamma/tau [Bacillus sp. FJAT-49736]